MLAAITVSFDILVVVVRSSGGQGPIEENNFPRNTGRIPMYRRVKGELWCVCVCVRTCFPQCVCAYLPVCVCVWLVTVECDAA